MENWDRSHDWILYRCHRDLTRITIRFRGGQPTVEELIALRRASPQFRHVSPTTLREMIGVTGEIPLGEMPTLEAGMVTEAAESQGLVVIVESACDTSYFPVDRTTGAGWIIEDDAESERLTQEMLAAGIPVIDTKAQPDGMSP